jgi:hypothetical protein
VRWFILRTLLLKEALRHLANRGGLVFFLMLLVACLLLRFLGESGTSPASAVGGVQVCYIDVWHDGPLLQHLMKNKPAELSSRIVFRTLEEIPVDARGRILYPSNCAAIQMRKHSIADGALALDVQFWQPGADSAALAPYEAWFWRESLRFTQQRGLVRTEASGIGVDRQQLRGLPDLQSSLAAAFVLFSVFLLGVYLMPSMVCEERERGVLLAQALSPASPLEILTARFLFYPGVAILLAATIAGILRPGVLGQLVFWATLLVAVVGGMGIGTAIASIARTQRGASMGAMSYMLGVALLLFVCQAGNIPRLPGVALEYHIPRMLQAVFTGSWEFEHTLHLIFASLIAAGWVGLAAWLFQRQGWQ